MSDIRPDEDEERYYERVRRESARDKARNLDRKHMADWKPSPIVDEWACRNKACLMPVPVTQECENAFNTFNAILARRGEAAMRTDEVVVCDACRDLLRKKAQDSADRKVSEMARLVREYKAEPEPDEMRKGEIERQLERLGHPDVRGLVEAVKRRRESGGRTKARREDMP